MLDLYYLRDSSPIPEYPDEDQFLGGLELSEFERIEEVVGFVNSLGINMRFFDDFRLDSLVTIKVFRIAEKSFLECSGPKKEAYEKLYQIISGAISQSAGIIGFSD